MQPRNIVFTVLFIIFLLAAASVIPPIYNVSTAQILPERHLLYIHGALLAFGGVQLIYHGVRKEVWFSILLVMVGVLEVGFSLILSFKTSALWDYGTAVLAIIGSFLLLNAATNLLQYLSKKGPQPV